MSKRRLFEAFLVAVALGAAASWVADGCVERPLNRPLTSYDPTAGYRFEEFDPPGENTNRLFVCLVLSGGGTRAAALSYGVLRAMRDMEPFEWPPASGRQVTLLDEVDVICSVSGGSFTAAYYGLFGERIFVDFEERFLRRNFTRLLEKAMVNPANWLRLASGNFDRIDLAAELYGEQVFEDRTFGDMRARATRPFIVLNATNVAYGSQFPFTQDSFDFLSSDLASYPVARAVAASSAFPILLSPVTLRNYPRLPGQELPEWFLPALEKPEVSARRYVIARTFSPYLEDKERHAYLHLVDGGLSDNLGLRYVIDQFKRGSIRSLMDTAPVRNGVAGSRIENLLVIVVNARPKPPEGIDRHPASPGVIKVADKTTSVSMENYTTETIELMRDLFHYSRQSQQTLLDVNTALKSWGVDRQVPELPRVRSQVVHISLEGLAKEKERKKFLAVRTSFDLPGDVVTGLIEKGEELFSKHQQLRQFLDGLR